MINYYCLDCNNTTVIIPHFTVPTEMSKRLLSLSSSSSNLDTLLIVQKSPSILLVSNKRYTLLIISLESILLILFYYCRVLTSLVTLKYYYNNKEVRVSSLDSPILIEFPYSHNNMMDPSKGKY